MYEETLSHITSDSDATNQHLDKKKSNSKENDDGGKKRIN